MITVPPLARPRMHVLLFLLVIVAAVLIVGSGLTDEP
jgi:hypothetical protein